jgi:ADP-ribose pyrophosphatase YjhB (NUDIX family)
MKDTMPHWLVWAREIQALAQTGLAFSEGEYDRKRYTRLSGIAAEITAVHSSLEVEDLERSFLLQPGYATPKIDVRAAIVKEGKILLVQEREDERWCMPGGWADVGEIPSQMISREVREESGYEAVPRKIIGVFDANRGGRPLEFYHAFKIVFLCDIVGGSPRPSEETLAVEFFPFEQLPPLSSNRTNERHLDEIREHLADANRRVAFD